jgi:5'-nucleotidase
MNIFLTNDDGIDAEGLLVMARAVSSWLANAPEGAGHQAIIAAPHANYSGMSSALGDIFEHASIPYRRRALDGVEGIPTFELTAPPALCALLGGLGTFGWVPDLILSGINPGANVGRSVLHSGTVGAVLTGAQMGISGLAVSMQWGETVHYDTAAHLALEVLEELLASPVQATFNLNVPNVPLADLRGVRRARISLAEVVEAAGPLAGGEPLGDAGLLPLRWGAASPSIGDVSGEDADDDGALVESGYAALTPLQGPRENNDLALDAVVRSSLARLSHHIEQGR